MDHKTWNVIYVDRRAHEAVVGKESSSTLISWDGPSPAKQLYSPAQQPLEVTSNVDAILSLFRAVHVCGSGSSCLSKLSELHQSHQINEKPTIVLLDVPYDEERLRRLSRQSRTPSPNTFRKEPTDYFEQTDLYGVHLLLHLTSQIQQRTLSRLVVPVVMLTGPSGSNSSPSLTLNGNVESHDSMDTMTTLRYIDAGAADVVRSPLSKDHVQGLAVRAYRAYKEVVREDSKFLAKRGRKISWVGVDEAKPFAYLREAMVSKLMNGICNPENCGYGNISSDIEVTAERRMTIAEAIGRWDFSAHDFSEDELLLGALFMLEHTLEMPGLERWRKSTDDLITFLLASRTAYNDFVLYHNFRHVVDVLQALFHFLVQIGAIPPYPKESSPPQGSRPAIASLIKPFDALTLLISAIGHDVGHPGVNNAFLVALNAPLAQLYNDRSVLESFHCAAYSQILRRYWPEAFSDTSMRKLMINTILATDMGLHFKYMSDLRSLQEKLARDSHSLDGWNLKFLEEYRDLMCGLLIKCADISNVARKFEVAAQWASVLTDEFSNQGEMEKELNMQTCLFGGPPARDDLVKLGESQIGFMNIFARPLFEAVSEVLPPMRFSVDEIMTNKTTWEEKIQAEKERRSRSDRLEPPDCPMVNGRTNSQSGSEAGLSDSRSSALHTQSDATPIAPQSPTAVSAHLSFSTVSSPRSPRRQAIFPESASSSRRSSLGYTEPTEKTSRESSGGPLHRSISLSSQPSPVADLDFPSFDSREQVLSQQRRSSDNPSITAIFVTQHSPSMKDSDSTVGRSLSPPRNNRGKSSPETPNRSGQSYCLRPKVARSISPISISQQSYDASYPLPSTRSDNSASTKLYHNALLSRSSETNLRNHSPVPARLQGFSSRNSPNGLSASSHDDVSALDGRGEGPRQLPLRHVSDEKANHIKRVTKEVEAQSPEAADQALQNRQSKFGLGKLWRKRWKGGAWSGLEGAPPRNR